MATVFKQVKEQTWEEKLAELEEANATPEEIEEAKAAFEEEFGIVEPVELGEATVEAEEDGEDEEDEEEEEEDDRNIITRTISNIVTSSTPSVESQQGDPDADADTDDNQDIAPVEIPDAEVVAKSDEATDQKDVDYTSVDEEGEVEEEEKQDGDDDGDAARDDLIQQQNKNIVELDENQQALNAALAEVSTPQETIDALFQKQQELEEQQEYLADQVGNDIQSKVFETGEAGVVSLDAVSLADFYGVDDEKNTSVRNEDITIERLSEKHPNISFTPVPLKFGSDAVRMTATVKDKDGKYRRVVTDLDLEGDIVRAYEDYLALLAQAKGFSEEEAVDIAPRQTQGEIDGLVSKYKPANMSTSDWIDSLAPRTEIVIDEAAFEFNDFTRQIRGDAIYSNDPIAYERNQLIYEIYKSLEKIRTKSLVVDADTEITDAINYYYDTLPGLQALAEKHDLLPEEVRSLFNESEGMTPDDAIDYLEKHLSYYPDYSIIDYQKYRAEQFNAEAIDKFAEAIAPVNVEFAEKEQAIKEPLLDEYWSDYSPEERESYDEFVANPYSLIEKISRQFLDTNNDGAVDALDNIPAPGSEEADIIDAKIIAAVQAETTNFITPHTERIDSIFTSNQELNDLEEDHSYEFKRTYDEVSKNFEVSTKFIPNDYLEKIDIELESNNFMNASYIEKKLMLGYIWDRDWKEKLIGADVHEADAIKQEFWAHFYNKLGFSQSHQIGQSLFATKDMSVLMIDKCEDEIDNLWEDILEILIETGGFVPDHDPSEGVKTWKEYDEETRQSIKTWFKEKLPLMRDFYASVSDEADQMVTFYDDIVILEEAISKYRDILEKPEQEWDSAIRNFLSGMASLDVSNWIPILNGIVDTNEAYRMYEISNKLPEQRTAAEEMMLTQYVLQQTVDNALAERSQSYRVGTMVAHSIPFMADMLLTTGAYSGTRNYISKAIKKRIRDHIRKTGKVTLSSKFLYGTAPRVFSVVGGLMVQTAANPFRVTASGLGFAQDQHAWVFEDPEEGEYDWYNQLVENNPRAIPGETDVKPFIRLVKVAEGNSIPVSMIKGYGMTATDLGTERLGIHITRFAGKALTKLELDEFVRRFSIARYMEKYGLSKAEFVQRVKEGLYMESVVVEILEEFAAMPIQNFIMGNDWLEGFVLYDKVYNEEGELVKSEFVGMDWENLQDLSYSVAVPTTTMSTVSVVAGAGTSLSVNGLGYRNTETDIQKFKDKLESMDPNDVTSIGIKGMPGELVKWIKDYIKKNGLDPNILTDRGGFSAREARIVANTIEILSALSPINVERYNNYLNRKADLERQQNEAYLIENTPKRKAELDRIEKEKTALEAELDQYAEIRAAEKESRSQARKKVMDENIAKVRARMKLLGIGNDMLQVFANKQAVIDYLTDWLLTEGGVETEAEARAIAEEQAGKKAEVHRFGSLYTSPKNGKQVIWVNEEAAMQTQTEAGLYVAEHELLHLLLRKILKDNPEIGVVLGGLLKNYINAIDPTMAPVEFQKRLKDYEDKYGDVVAGEETLTLFVDALNLGYFKNNPNILTKIGGYLKGMFNAKGYDIQIKTPQDVYDLLVGYNQGKQEVLDALERGGITLSEDIQDVADKVKTGIEEQEEARRAVEELRGILVEMYQLTPDQVERLTQAASEYTPYSEVTEEDKARSYELSSEESKLIQDLFRDKPRDWESQVVMAYMPMLNRIIARNIARAESASTADKLEATQDDQYAGGIVEIMNLIRTYDPAKQAYDNPAAYIGGLLETRMRKVFSDVIGGEVGAASASMDVAQEEGGGVRSDVEAAAGATETTEEFFLDETGAVLTVNLLDAAIVGEQSDDSKNTIREAVIVADVGVKGVMDKIEAEGISVPMAIRELVLSNTNPNPNTSKGVEFTGPLIQPFLEICEIIGIDPKRTVSRQTLTNKQRNAVRDWIVSSKNEEGRYTVIDTLPLHYTPDGDAVGVFPSLLDAFFAPYVRAATKEATDEGLVGMKAKGLDLFTNKIAEMSMEEIDALLGINSDGTYASGTKFDQLLKALVKQYSIEAIRQEMKINYGELNSAEVFAIFGYGRAESVYSEVTEAQAVGQIDNIEGLAPEDKFKFRSKLHDFGIATNFKDIDSVTKAIETIYAGEEGILAVKDILAQRIVAAMTPIVDGKFDGATDAKIQKLITQALERGVEDPRNIKAFLNNIQTSAENEAQTNSDVRRDVRAFESQNAQDIWDSTFDPTKPSTISDALFKINLLKGHTITSPSRTQVINPGNKQRGGRNVELWTEIIIGAIPVIGPLQAGEAQVYRSKLDPLLTFELNAQGGIKYSTVKYNGKSVDVDASLPTMDADKLTSFTPEELAEHNKKIDLVQEVLNGYVEEASDLFKQGKISATTLQVIMGSLLSNQSTILALSAKYKWDQEGVREIIEQSGTGAVEVEHMIPRVVMLLDMFNQHINGSGIDNVSEYLENYQIAVISKDMNDALVEMGVGQSLAPGQTIEDLPWFRYYFELHPDLGRLISKETGEVLEVSNAVAQTLNALNIIGVDIDNANSVELNKKLLDAYFENRGEDNGASVWDFDDTLAKTQSLVKWTAPDGSTGTLTAKQYAAQYVTLLGQEYTFDFSNFNKVENPSAGPLLDELKSRVEKYGLENMFILTARAPEAQEAIYEFMKGIGLEIPAENIIGLGNSTAKAKADWIANNLILAGYNNIYFADDARANVEAVKDMFALFDVNSVVEIANADLIANGESRFSEIIEEGEKDLSGDLNIIVEETTGTERQKDFSAAKARERGKNKGRFKFFIPPSAEDFEGLIYSLLGKGEVGEKHHEWFKKNLFDPYSEGIRNLNSAKQTVANEAKQLKKQMPEAAKKINKAIPGLPEYTYDTAVRVYNWVKNGIDVPGLSQTDQNKLVRAVQNDTDLLSYALAVDVLTSKAGGYAKLENNVGWLAGSIDGDISRSLTEARERFLATWIENKNIIFSEANLNKIEAVYGTAYRSALEDSLYRMETGSTRSAGTDATTQRFMNWINGSIGTTMFFNARSALLQMLSSVNFINWNDNSIIEAGKAFANQPQYWADVNMIFHSDYLKERRGGSEFDLNLSEFSNELSKAKNPMAVVIGKLIQLGYTPTKFADSLAIATGGATFYRNRVNTYVNQGMSKSEAEAQAFLDMQEIAETTQQSARPDKISQIQASPLGKLIFAFQNTPMQYTRIIKRAVEDLVAGRGDTKTHISKIIYYGAIQNVLFYGMQTALFAFMFDDDEEENQEVAYSRTLNGMVDTLLRGSGLPGAVVATAKNIILEFYEQQDKAQPDHAYTVLEALNISPPVGIKARNMYNTLQTWEYNEDVANQMEMTDFDNPLWSASTQGVQVVTNLPTNKIYNKIKNVREAFNPDHETWKRIAMFLGWSSWSLGIEPEGVAEAEAEIKEQKKEAKEEQKKAEEQAQIKENIEKQNEERENNEVVQCAAVNKEGVRCSNKALPGENFCTIHMPVPQQEKEVRCKHIKKDGKQCKNMTKNKSGKCYYHD